MSSALDAATARGDGPAALEIAADLCRATRGYLPRGASLRRAVVLCCRRGEVREAVAFLESMRAALARPRPPGRSGRRKRPWCRSRRCRPLDATGVLAALRALPASSCVAPELGKRLVESLAALAVLEPRAFAREREGFAHLEATNAASLETAAASRDRDTAATLRQRVDKHLTGEATDTDDELGPDLARRARRAHAKALRFATRRAVWATMELLEETAAAFGAILGSEPKALARAGRCVFGVRCRPGKAADELECAGGDDGGGEARRGLQSGDAVALSPVGEFEAARARSLAFKDPVAEARGACRRAAELVANAAQAAGRARRAEAARAAALRDCVGAAFLDSQRAELW